MISQHQLGKTEQEQKAELFKLIHRKSVHLGGHKKGKVYGLLSCKAGKRMKAENRVFFNDEKDAVSNGYRPCGACLPKKYSLWKGGRFFTKNLKNNSNEAE